MEKLKIYLKSLSVKERIAYASACGTTYGYLHKAIYTSKTPVFDAALALKLEKHSDGSVKKHELRPDVWPELVAA